MNSTVRARQVFMAHQCSLGKTSLPMVTSITPVSLSDITRLLHAREISIHFSRH